MPQEGAQDQEEPRRRSRGHSLHGADHPEDRNPAGSLRGQEHLHGTVPQRGHPVGSRARCHHQPVQRVLWRRHERHRLPGAARGTRSGLFGCCLLPPAQRAAPPRVCDDLHHHPERQDDGLHPRVQQHRGHHSPERGSLCPGQGRSHEEAGQPSHRSWCRPEQLHECSAHGSRL